MKIPILALLLSSLPAFAQTSWFVRPDGGTRFSSNVTTGQCSGLADAPYPGSGTNQACAFNDVRFLWQDGTQQFGGNNPGYNWIIAGGDIVTIRGSIADGVTYRLGWDSAAGCGITPNARGICGDSNDSGMPSPPSGTSGQHTIIRGGNYASCTSQTARTQLHGGFGVDNVIFMGVPLQYTGVNLSNSAFVDLQCLDITDFAGPGGTDFAKYGINFSLLSHDVTLTDIRVHGIVNTGILGSPSGPINSTDIQIVGNGLSGWNTDKGDGNTGVGVFNVTNFDISWNGCTEEYPLVDPLPYVNCRDDVTGGYGDGFGTASVASPSPGWQVHFDQGTATYNTQDGLDAKHVSGAGSTMTVTRVLTYGNEGQQIKVGDGATATIQNSVIVGNCEALNQVITGRPVPTGDSLGDVCRAGNTAIVIDTTPGLPSVFQDNTVFSEGSVGLEVEYATSDFGPTNILKFNNNVFFGFFNSGNAANPSPIYSVGGVDGAGGGAPAIPAVLTNSGASWTNNATHGGKSSWVCGGTGESSAVCGDPGLVDETYHAYSFGNMAPASTGSAVSGAGITIAGITVDYAGVTRPNPPAIGALEFTGSAPTLASMALTPNPGTVTVGNTLALTCTSTFSDSSTAACSGPTWVSATPAKATINSSGVVTGVATGTSVVTASIGAVTSPGDTITVNAAPSAPVAIHGHSKISGRAKFH
jgi:hypothetical protein